MWSRDGRKMAVLIGLLLLGHAAPIQATSEPDTLRPARPPVRVEIAIRARQFTPSPARLPAGREIVLVLHNHDAELHAFVPIRFLERVSLHFNGNGAPQFDEKGLIRVLIPSDGEAEIRFTTPAAGTYQYRCDLPGHQMLGELLVQEQLPDRGQERSRHELGIPSH